MHNHDHKSRGAHFSLLLILLLVGSNLATAIGAYLAIDRISGRYVEEINATAPGMHDVMVLAQKATDVHRSAAALLIARTPAEEAQMLARLDDARARESKRRRQILDTPSRGPEAAASRKALGEAASGYEAALGAYLGLLKSGDKTAAQDHRLSVLRDAFELYQLRQREESVRLNLEAMQSGLELTDYANTRQGWLLGIGVWPLALLGLMLIGVAVLGVMLWRQLRRMEAETGDAPTPRGLKF